MNNELNEDILKQVSGGSSVGLTIRREEVANKMYTLQNNMQNIGMYADREFNRLRSCISKEIPDFNGAYRETGRLTVMLRKGGPECAPPHNPGRRPEEDAVSVAAAVLMIRKVQ